MLVFQGINMERKYIEEYGKVCKIYTADDEMPDCGVCEHMSYDDSPCNLCGGEHGWNNYIRIEVPEK